MYHEPLQCEIELNGSEQDKKFVMDQLKKNDDFQYYYLNIDFSDDSSLCTFQADERVEDELVDFLHEIALQIPNAQIILSGYGSEDSANAFQAKFEGNLYQHVDLQTMMPPFMPHNDVAFEARMNHINDNTPSAFALTLLTELQARTSGNDLVTLIGIHQGLDEVGDLLSPNERLKLADRILNASYASDSPLLVAERTDAVRALLSEGISQNRFPSLQPKTPEETKAFLLNASLNSFMTLTDLSAEKNQERYRLAPIRDDELLDLSVEMIPRNTEINYLYRDDDNYKVYNQCVIDGVLSEPQQQYILSTLEDGEYFIPQLVGLPEVKFAVETERDHPWFELSASSFQVVTKRPDVSIKPDELVRAFQSMKGRWEETITELQAQDEHVPIDQLIDDVKERQKNQDEPQASMDKTTPVR